MNIILEILQRFDDGLITADEARAQFILMLADLEPDECISLFSSLTLKENIQ